MDGQDGLSVDSNPSHLEGIDYYILCLKKEKESKTDFEMFQIVDDAGQDDIFTGDDGNIGHGFGKRRCPDSYLWEIDSVI